MKLFHKLQALSLIVAVALLWGGQFVGLTHNTSMIVSSVIIVLNVGVEVAN